MYDQVLIGKKDTHHERINVFVLKTYRTGDADPFFWNECKPFRRLKGFLELLDFYGSVRHAEIYNVILEYADLGTLEELL